MQTSNTKCPTSQPSVLTSRSKLQTLKVQKSKCRFGILRGRNVLKQQLKLITKELLQLSSYTQQLIRKPFTVFKTGLSRSTNHNLRTSQRSQWETSAIVAMEKDKSHENRVKPWQKAIKSRFQKLVLRITIILLKSLAQLARILRRSCQKKANKLIKAKANKKLKQEEVPMVEKMAKKVAVDQEFDELDYLISYGLNLSYLMRLFYFISMSSQTKVYEQYSMNLIYDSDARKILKLQKIISKYSIIFNYNIQKKKMGQKLIKGYNIEGQTVSSAGTNGMWKIYNAVKQGNNMHVSVFMIEKRTIKKADKEETLKLAKKEAMGLMKVRHPGVLAIVEPLTEDENIVAFVTEKVVGDLSSVIKQQKYKSYVSSQLQLRLNFFPIIETLSFLNGTVKQAHKNLNLNSIYITEEGKWKIGGLGFCQSLANQTLQEANQSRNFDFISSAPEYVIQNKYNDRSDVFSVGVLIINMIFALHGKGQQLIVLKSKQQYESKKGYICQLYEHSIVKNSENPKELAQMLKEVFTWQTSKRCSLDDIASNRWLNDKPILTVKYLESITNYENKQQLQFLKGLSGVIHTFHKKVIHSRILPKLMDLLKFNHLIASIIYIAVDLMKKQTTINADQFKKIVWPHIKAVTQGKQMTAQSLYILVDNIDIFDKYITLTEITSTIVPLYLKCFDCPQKLKQLALKKTEHMAKKLQYQFFKAKVIPKLVVVMKDNTLQVRKKSLIALKKILPIIDSQTIATHVLTGLENSRKAGTDGFINAITVSIYGSIAKNLSADIIGTKIVPTLLPYLVDPTVNKSDFMLYKNLMNTMLMKIEEQRSKSWRDTDSQKNIEHFSEKDFQFQVQENTVQKKQEQQPNYNFLKEYINPPKKEDIPSEDVQGNSNSNQSQGLNFNNMMHSQSQQQTRQSNNQNQVSPRVQDSNSMDFNFGSAKNIDYDPFASLSNVNPVQANFNSYEKTSSSNTRPTNNISFDFNTGNDMNFGMGIGNISNINQNQNKNWNAINTQLSSGNSIAVSNTQPTSPPTFNISSNYDFSGLSTNQNQLGNQSSPSKAKPNLQGPNQSNNKPIKPLSKPGQSTNQSSNLMGNSNYDFNKDMNSFNFGNINSNQSNNNDPFNFQITNTRQDYGNNSFSTNLGGGINSYGNSLGSNSNNNNNFNFGMGSNNNSDPFGDIQGSNNGAFNFQRNNNLGMGMNISTNNQNQFSFNSPNIQNNNKKSNNDDFNLI